MYLLIQLLTWVMKSSMNTQIHKVTADLVCLCLQRFSEVTKVLPEFFSFLAQFSVTNTWILSNLKRNFEHFVFFTFQSTKEKSTFPPTVYPHFCTLLWLNIRIKQEWNSEYMWISSYLRVVAEVQVSTLWMVGTSATGINMGLIEGLQQPHKVGTVTLKIKHYKIY